MANIPTVRASVATFVSAGGATQTIAFPGTPQVGDPIGIWITGNDFARTIPTAPTGWTLEYSTAVGTGDRHFLHKVYTSSDGTGVVVTFSKQPTTSVNVVVFDGSVQSDFGPIGTITTRGAASTSASAVGTGTSANPNIVIFHEKTTSQTSCSVPGVTTILNTLPPTGIAGSVFTGYYDDSAGPATQVATYGGTANTNACGYQIPILLATVVPSPATGTATLDLEMSVTAGTSGTGTGSLTLSATSSASVADAGAGSLVLSAAMLPTVPVSGTGSLTLSGAATGTGTQPATATGALSLSGAASPNGYTPASGSGDLELQASASTSALVSATGTLVLDATASASGKQPATASASLSLALSATSSALATASASVTLSGSAQPFVTYTGSLSLVVSMVAKAAATASASVTLSAAATLVARSAASGSLTLSARSATILQAWLAVTPWYVAHRGGSFDWVEETMYAYTQAAAWNKTMGLEISVWKSSDGVWVCSHDQTTGRLFGTNLDITTSTWANLSTLRTTTGGYPLAKLTDVLDAFATGNRIFFVDNKGQQTPSAFLDLLDTYGGNARFVSKGFCTATTMADAATARGYQTWGYYYDADVATNLPNTASHWSLLGMDYTATAQDWATIMTYGKPVLGHIIDSLAAANTAFSRGASGVVASAVKEAVPNDTFAATGSLSLSGQATAVPQATATSGLSLSAQATSKAVVQATGSVTVAVSGALKAPVVASAGISLLASAVAQATVLASTSLTLQAQADTVAPSPATGSGLLTLVAFGSVYTPTTGVTHPRTEGSTAPVGSGNTLPRNQGTTPYTV